MNYYTTLNIQPLIKQVVSINSLQLSVYLFNEYVKYFCLCCTICFIWHSPIKVSLCNPSWAAALSSRCFPFISCMSRSYKMHFTEYTIYLGFHPEIRIRHGTAPYISLIFVGIYIFIVSSTKFQTIKASIRHSGYA